MSKGMLLQNQLVRILPQHTMEARLREWSKLLDLEEQYGNQLTQSDKVNYLAHKESVLYEWRARKDLSAEERQQVELMIQYRLGLDPKFKDPEIIVKPDGTIETGAIILNPKNDRDRLYNEAIIKGYKNIEEMMKANEAFYKEYGFDECLKLTDGFSRAMCGFQKGFTFIPKAVIKGGGETVRTGLGELGKTFDELFKSPGLLAVLVLGAIIVLNK